MNMARKDNNWFDGLNEIKIPSEPHLFCETSSRDFGYFKENSKCVPNGRRISNELVLTEARKLNRQEKFCQLGTKKMEKILTREIDLFRDNLQIYRNINKVEFEAREQQSLRERKYRQIRTETSKIIKHDFSFQKKRNIIDTLTQMGPTQKKIQKPPTPEKKCQKIQDIQDKPNLSARKLPDVKTEDNSEKNSSVVAKESTKNYSNRKSKKDTLRKNKTDFLRNYIAYKCKLYYWSQWKLYVATRKKEKEDEKIWREKINNFMQRLHERSTHQNSTQTDENGKKSRRKTAPAKTKISHPNKGEKSDQDLDTMALEIAKSAAETRHQLRAKSITSLHPSLKGKAKLVRLVTTVVSKEEEEEKHLEFPQPEILEDMNRRNEERKQRLMEIQERKRKVEEEKDRIVREKYQQQLLDEEKEKRRKIQQFREKLKKERIEQEKRKQEWIRIKELNETAIRHYNYKLITQSGFFPWYQVIQRRRGLNVKAEKQNDRRIQRTYFKTWKMNVERIQEDKMIKAIAFRAKILLKTGISGLKGLVFQRNQHKQVAEDWYDHLIIRTTFKSWLNFIFLEQQELQDKWKKAVNYHKMKMVTKCLQHWMLLPQILYLEREKESRKKEWREKVQQVLPDFQPILIPEF